jgi:hypothetical protein
MKKINLKHLTAGLKRDQLRMIHGGSGCGSPVGSFCYPGHNIFNCAQGLTCVAGQNPYWPGNEQIGVCK